MPFWTIEEVADHLDLTVTQVRESRRKGEYPGVLGRMRGRRLAFDVDLVKAGPQVAKSTTDPLEAILWTLVGIEAKLDSLVKIGVAQARSRLAQNPTAQDLFDAYCYAHHDHTTTTGDEEE